MRRAAASIAILVLVALPQAALALSGHITNISGAVLARAPDGTSRLLSIRSEVKEGDLLVTADNSFARVKFTDGSEVVLRPGSQLKINAYRFEERDPAGDGFFVSLLKGGMRSITGLLARRNPNRATYITPTANIGIRGTHFGALLCNDDCANVPTLRGDPPANGLHVDVADGKIVLITLVGELEYSVGQFGFAASSAVAPVLVPANRGIRVLLPPQSSSSIVPGRGVGKSGALECVI